MNSGNDGWRSLLGLAILAPSSHNTQPWYFQVDGSTVDLFADRTRALPVNDPHDRELVISCGCALENLRIAAASAGSCVDVTPFPKPSDPDLLARVVVNGQSGSLAGAELAEFIPRRRTYRMGFSTREVDAAVVERLVEAADGDDAHLWPLLRDEHRLRAAALVDRGDHVQWSDPRWRRELAAWMHPRRQGDGLSVPALAAPVARVVVRTFDMGDGVGAKDRDVAEGSPLLAILSTDGDDPQSWLRAGQALQRTLLVGCQLGLQASYLNQPVQVESLRAELGALVGARFPQILMRLGYPLEDVPPAPRRPLGDVIEQVGGRAAR